MSLLTRYLVAAYLRALALSLAIATALFLVVDVFDRLGEVLPFSPSAAALLSYFLFKLPKILFDVLPAAALLATLVAIGALVRSREVMAMRACGLGDRRLATPILVAAALTSAGALFWNESVVPVSASRSRWLWDFELKQKAYRGVFDAASLWFQTEKGFVHVERYDADHRVILGLSLFEADRNFDLVRVYETPRLEWDRDHWRADEGLVKELGGRGEVRIRALAAGELTLAEDPDNLATRRRRPEEFSFRQLRAQIALLEARGSPADDLLVDLHHKLAWPLATVIVTMLALPMALAARPSSGMAASIGAGFVVGFAYWVVTGMALSAGRSGALAPAVAAWTANALSVAVALAIARLR